MQRATLKTSLRSAPVAPVPVRAVPLRVAVHAQAAAAASAPVAQQAPQQQVNNAVSRITLPARPAGEKGPRSEAVLQAAADEAIKALTVQGKEVALLSCPDDKFYIVYELMLVLATFFAKHKAADVQVAKFAPKQQQQQEQQAPPTSYLRLAVKPSAASATPLAEAKERLFASKASNAVTLAIAMTAALQKDGAVRVAGLGPLAVSAMMQAVQRASVRARTSLKQQLVITSVVLEELNDVSKPVPKDDARGPAKSVVLTLHLKPLSPAAQAAAAAAPASA